MPMTVEELSRRSGVAATTVRYYTRRGLLQPQRDPSNQYRLYGEPEYVRLRFILQAKWLGFSLSEIRKLLETADRGVSPCHLARKMLERGLDRTEHEIAALRELQQRREYALADWKLKPDRVPDGLSICHLVESVAPCPVEEFVCDHPEHLTCEGQRVG